MNTELEKAARQALEVLDMVDRADDDRDFLMTDECKRLCDSITALRRALERPAQQEPVAWATQLGEYAHIQWGAKRPEYPMVYEFPLYTRPQAREWVGLTDEEANELWESTDSDWELMKRTEAKLREKNA